jgi:hypothetical protein
MPNNQSSEASAVMMGAGALAALGLVIIVTTATVMKDTDSAPDPKHVTEIDAPSYAINHNCDTEDTPCVVLFTDPEYGCEYFLTDAWRASPTLTPRAGSACFTDEPLLQPTDPVIEELEEVFEYIDPTAQILDNIEYQIDSMQERPDGMVSRALDDPAPTGSFNSRLKAERTDGVTVYSPTDPTDSAVTLLLAKCATLKTDHQLADCISTIK